MEITRSCSGREVLASGTLFTFERDGNARLDMKLDESFGFAVEFRFRSTADGVPACATEVENGTLVFTCTNFVQSNGSGSTVPVQIATYDDKKVFMFFWIYWLGENTSRKIEYNIYSE